MYPANKDGKMVPDCGHEVESPEEVVAVPEIDLCFKCYVEGTYPADGWPSVLNEQKSFAGVNYHGSAEYHKTCTRFVGIDEKGRGVYLDEANQMLLYYIPMNDNQGMYREMMSELVDNKSSYNSIRSALGCSPEEHQQCCCLQKGDSKLRPAKYHKSGSEGEPSVEGDYHTLPNGDHIVKVEYKDLQSYDYFNFNTWMEENTEDWIAVK